MRYRWGLPTWELTIFVLTTSLVVQAPARSQEVPGPSSSPPAVGATITIEQLAERLAKMEAANKSLSEELVATRKAQAEQTAQMQILLEKLGKASNPTQDVQDENAVKNTAPAAAPTPPDRPNEDGDSESPAPDYTEGQFAPFTPPPGYTLPKSPPPKNGRMPLHGTFGPGFQFETEDAEYRLQIHYESQIEGRAWSQANQTPANSGIFLPRQRIFFNGNITKAIEYELAINRGFGSLGILNAFVNIHFDDRFELRLGRFFTPMNYDQYAISNYWMPTPERSLYTTNVGLNRQFGAMGWGYLFDKRLDYAAGVFNGSRNSFENLTNAVDFVTYLNTRPFQESELFPWIRLLNMGTSFAYGYQNQSPVPVAFRIAGGSPSADSPGPGTTPFLILNRDVVERGERLLGSVHAAYFYKGLSLISEWQYGYGGYATTANPSSKQVPFSGFYVSGGYFLTGEHVERRTRVKPLRPFIKTNPEDQRGPGAWEAVARVSELLLGDEIFKGGFADANLWSNQAITTELGLNWYWNEYIKLYMFWLHGDFADPVQYRPGSYQKTADMFWMRFQLYF